MRTTHSIRQAFETGTSSERLLEALLVFANLDEWLPWLAARQFTGATLSNKGEDWLLTVKAQYGRKHQVSFTGGDSPEEAILVAVHQLAFGLTRWREDKFRTMRIDNQANTR